MQAQDVIVHVATRGSNVRPLYLDQILAPPLRVVIMECALTRTRLRGSPASVGAATLECCVKRLTTVLIYFKSIPRVIAKNVGVLETRFIASVKMVGVVNIVIRTLMSASMNPVLKDNNVLTEKDHSAVHRYNYVMFIIVSHFIILCTLHVLPITCCKKVIFRGRKITKLKK